jgi:hypothetical protein
MARKSAHDPMNISRWYAVLQEIITEHSLQPCDIANVDQTGFRVGISKPQRIITRNKNKIVWIPCPNNREFIIITEGIMADNIALFSQIILSEKCILKKYIIVKLHDDV